MKLLLTFLLFLLGCSTTQPSREDLASLRTKYEEQLELLRKNSETHLAGWPSDNECDGALWAGIARAAGATWVDVTAAVQPDGRTTRMPYSDCGPGNMGYNNGSATTISNDMLTGIMLGLYADNDAQTAKMIWEYGYSHNWTMGYPEYYVSRVLLRPNGITMLARLVYHTSDGKYDYAARFGPILYGPVAEDFEGHLMMLGRYLEAKLGGPQYGMEIAELVGAKYRQGDAFAQAVAGEYSKATTLLLGAYQYPSYVRGHSNYQLVHWLIAAKIVLDEAGG